MFRLIRIGLICSVLSLSAPFVSAALACPMCSEANKTEDKLPQAYMYSILFMLSVPATLMTAFGIGFYRLSKKGNQGFAESPAGDSEEAVRDEVLDD